MNKTLIYLVAQSDADDILSILSSTFQSISNQTIITFEPLGDISLQVFAEDTLANTISETISNLLGIEEMWVQEAILDSEVDTHLYC